jgi:MinD-like ATPase involved in chromosome partitioning or flagellar assembly
MMTVGLTSAKHSPGTTTAVVALALAADDGALAIEADPAGGDVAARAHLSLEPGLLTMAAASRHAASQLTLRPQRLPSGAEVVVSTSDPDQTSAALAAIADRLVAAVRAHGGGFLDCGRWSPVTTTETVLAACDAIVMVTDPTVAGVEHVRCRLESIAALGRPVNVLLVGDHPYAPGDVEAALSVPVIGSLAVDPRGALSVYDGPPRVARKSALCRSARSALDRLAELADRAEVPA